MSTFKEQIEAIVGFPVKIIQTGSIFSLQRAANAKTPLPEGAPATDRENAVLATWRMCQLPGCCGVVVSYHAHVLPPFARKGLGKLLNKLRIKLAWEAGYTAMVCTDKRNNEPQQKILAANNWKLVHEFRNRRTTYMVGIHARALEPLPIQTGFQPLGVAVPP